MTRRHIHTAKYTPSNAPAVVLQIVVMGLCCCYASPTTVPPKIPRLASPKNGVDVTRIALLSDTHFTNLSGYRVLKSMSCASDESGTGAIRPPVLDLWAPKVLDYVLEQAKNQGLVIHLGDAATIACTGEFQSFATLMNEHVPGKWFMAPGNHDSFLMGNWNYAQLPDRPAQPEHGRKYCSADRSDCMDSWAGACVDESSGSSQLGPQHLYKRRFIDLYLGAIGQRSLTAKDGWACQDYAKMRPDAMLERICRFDKDDVQFPEFGHHFLLQQVRLSKDVAAVIVDTSDLAPGSINTAGRFGGISGIQAGRIREWFLDLGKGTHPRRAIVFGHLPIAAFRFGPTLENNALLSDPAVLAYVSAHNHQSAQFCERGFRNFNGVELNVGSVLDWPMEYGFLSFFPKNDRYAIAYEKRSVALDLKDACGDRPAGTAYASYCDGMARTQFAPSEQSVDARLEGEDALYHTMLGDELRSWMHSTQPPRAKDESGLKYARRMIGERAHFQETTELKQIALCHARWASEDEHKKAGEATFSGIIADPDRCPGRARALDIPVNSSSPIYIDAPPLPEK